MAITITTLNNSSAVAKTFTEIGKDRVSSEWLNTTDGPNPEVRLKIMQKVNGRDPVSAATIRRTLVQGTLAVPRTVAVGTTEKNVPEQYTCNITFAGPELGNITDAMVKDLLAYLVNALTGSSYANLLALRRGEV